METIAGIRELRERIAQWRRRAQRIAFVPTMGNLHAGHGNLISEAATLADRVVVSVFVILFWVAAAILILMILVLLFR